MIAMRVTTTLIYLMSFEQTRNTIDKPFIAFKNVSPLSEKEWHLWGIKKVCVSNFGTFPPPPNNQSVCIVYSCCYLIKTTLCVRRIETFLKWLFFLSHTWYTTVVLELMYNFNINENPKYNKIPDLYIV